MSGFLIFQIGGVLPKDWVAANQKYCRDNPIRGPLSGCWSTCPRQYFSATSKLGIIAHRLKAAKFGA